MKTNYCQDIHDYVVMPKAVSMRKYFTDPIISKIEHIFNTATRDSKTTFNLGGCSHDVRVRWEMRYVRIFCDKYGYTELENYFPNGLVIVMRNNDYFDAKNSTDPFDKFVLERLGSDETISSVIHIESYESNCNSQIMNLIKQIQSDSTLKPLRKKNTRMSHKGSNSNTHWEGHYAIVAKGGNNKVNICEGKIPLGNPIYDYADQYTSESVEFQMVYMMLCSENAKILLKDQTKFDEVKEMYRQECEKRGLLQFEKFAPSTPIDEQGNLRCCVLNIMIKAEQFLYESTHNLVIEHCHIEAKSDSYAEIVDGRIQTTFRPYNIAWGHRWANRGQNEMTITIYRDMIKMAASQLP